MPQIVEVIKYVHEIVEQESLGVAIGVDIQTQEIRYKELYGNIKPRYEAILVELRKLKTNNPGLKVQIDLLEGFLVELNKLVAFPRIVQVEKEKIVEVDRNVPILVPKLDIEAERFQITLGAIISKLLGELLRIKEKNPNINLNIDAEILRIFSDQFKEKGGLLNIGGGRITDNLKKIYAYYDNFLGNLGGSNLSKEQEMIYLAALEERLLVATLVE